MTNKLDREYRRLVESEGAEVVGVRRGKHLKVDIMFSVDDGVIERTLVLPASPSDHRSIHNARAFLRRMMRSAAGNHAHA